MRRLGLLVACSLVVSNGAATAAADSNVQASVGCTVSDLLVPSCGAWLGTSIPSVDGNFDYAAGLSEYQAIAQNVPDIIHLYKTNGTMFPTAEEVALTERSGQQQSLLYYSWKPGTRLTWRQIANGKADDNIREVANGLKQYSGRLFLSIHHEPEDDMGPKGSGRTAADYVAMFRYVVEKLRAEGVTNAVFVMNYMGFAGWSDVADEFYPGDDVVDWIAYDPYAHALQPTFESLLNRPTNGWPGFYDWAVTRAPGKPIMLGEWGFDLAAQPAAPEALDGAVASLITRFPMLKALIYWNSKTEQFNYRLDQPGELATAYAAAYSRMANNLYFNATSIAAAFPAPTTTTTSTTTTTEVVTTPLATTPIIAAPSSLDTCESGPLVGAGCQTDGRSDAESRTSPTSSRYPLSMVTIVVVALLAGVFVRRHRRPKTQRSEH